MTVIQYLSNFVWISRQRKQMYKRVFLKYIKLSNEEDQDTEKPVQNSSNETEILLPFTEYRERHMCIEHLYQALEDVLEFYGTESNINRMLRLLNYDELKQENYLINFRSWCGIVAFAERLALDDPFCTDSCDEVTLIIIIENVQLIKETLCLQLEKSDFNSMELRWHAFKIPENLKQIFDIIRHTHNIHS